jgi:hypothetical protein
LENGEIRLVKKILPDSFFNKRFTVKIGTKDYLERKITKKGRIYLGGSALKNYQIGDILIIEINEEGMKIWKKDEHY